MKGNDWVPFHRRLAKGPKKSVRRGVRFVLLELSLEARATRGILDLPLAWTTVQAVHDLIGGDIREIRDAIQIFQIPDAAGAQVLKIERSAARHTLQILKWEDWAGPRSSTERVAEHRKRKETEGLDPPPALHGVTDETHVTAYNTNSTIQKSRGNGVTRAPPPPEQAKPEPESGYDLAHRVFADEWSAAFHRPYRWSSWMGKGSDDAAMQEVGGYARERGGDRAEDFMRHWAKSYVADTKPVFATEGHPARFLLSDVANKYGEPTAVQRPPPPVNPLTQNRMTPEQAAAKHRELDKRLADAAAARERNEKLQAADEKRQAAIRAGKYE